MNFTKNNQPNIINHLMYLQTIIEKRNFTGKKTNIKKTNHWVRFLKVNETLSSSALNRIYSKKTTKINKKKCLLLLLKYVILKIRRE